jgi:hypothetical protein
MTRPRTRRRAFEFPLGLLSSAGPLLLAHITQSAPRYERLPNIIVAEVADQVVGPGRVRSQRTLTTHRMILRIGVRCRYVLHFYDRHSVFNFD